jgi:hypothetical protein
MNTKLIALASALAATTALASAAEAGGGVRLGFGVPLGSFVATPAHGGNSYRAPRVKKAPAMHAAKKPQKPAQRVAKAEPRQEARKETVVDKTETKTKTEVTTEKTAPVTGSSALIQGTIPADESAPGTTAPDVKAEAPPEAAVTAHTDQVPDESEDCKKFIPAVGMTVSVGCE